MPIPYMEFRGTAHPSRIHNKRQHVADLTDGDIASMNLGNRSKRTTPLLVEHEGDPVGEIISSYDHHFDGSMRVMGLVYDKDVAQKVQSGALRGLSLSTHMNWEKQSDIDDPTKQPLNRIIYECSLCEVPGRDGCWIDVINDELVPSSRYSFSKRIKERQEREAREDSERHKHPGTLATCGGVPISYLSLYLSSLTVSDYKSSVA